MRETQTLVHLVYIHGFQGDHTSFQTFPKDLQTYLNAHILPRLGAQLRIQSSLYPTYKSRKPIAEATSNFLGWLSTQPAGPVILLAHSMGGLLAADVATHASNRGTPRRILGVVAFDVPYLGMHPHVVVSGIASLLPEKKEKAEKEQAERDGKGRKTEEELNRHPDVRIVERKVTEDWDSWKKDIDAKHARSRSQSKSPRLSPSPTPNASTSTLSVASTSSSSSPFFSKTMSFLSSQAEGKLGKWLMKHTNDPFSAGQRFIVEYFQFGSSAFDPSGLGERYTKLVKWGKEDGGLWVNYWTEVPAQERESVGDDGLLRVPTTESASNASAPPVLQALSQPTAASTSSLAVSSPAPKLKPPKEPKPHHFIVLPNGLGQHLGGLENWDKVVISGVADEVAAHTGLFIRGSNLGYEDLVARVGEKVLGWCEVLRG
ncbi:hypothetical protein MKEN_00733100 [Mycena kentingensis (nom. inval.)]|nr:hypothetical protein MKEN_00733100 [Mycena kentingensis (nom. inval.)]